MDFKGLLLITFCASLVLSQTIPEYLRECYENVTFRGPHLPMNLQIIIDIVRKAEKYSETSINMRTLSSSLLHRFKFDGIENYSKVGVKEGVLPFGGTGAQRFKHRIVEELVPGNPRAFPSEALTLEERCALHRAVSNTIWEHDDAARDKLCTEDVTDKLSAGVMPQEQKMCPLEYGVVLTPFGTISLGTVISAIAASLQPQNVTVKLLLGSPYSEISEIDKSLDSVNYNEDEVDFVMPKNQMALDRSMWLRMIKKSTTHIDNVWVSSVAGDLAEMAVYQGPVEGNRMVLGATGFWNSSMRPNIYYLVGRDGTFDATRAEMIGGVDGLIIAKKLPGWVDKFPNLRLSQVLDIYYYNEASSGFDGSTRACDRGRAFWNVAPITIMEEQTFATSQILAYRKSVAYMSEEVLGEMVKHAVRTFNSYTMRNLFSELRCPENEKIRPRIEALVAFDGAWSRSYTADFLSVLVDDLDVSVFGSRMGLIHGTSGDWLFNVTESTARVHYALANLNNYTWPSGINFANVLTRVTMYLDATWRDKHEAHKIGSLGQVIIFLAPRVTFNTVEQQTVLKLIKELKDKHPDVHFLYYTSEANANLFEPLLLTEEDHLVKTSGVNDVTDVLAKATRVLRPPECSVNATDAPKYQVEDYVAPRKSIVYRLHPHWRRNTRMVVVTVHSVGYGTVEICTWNKRRNNVRQDDLYCRRLSGHSETTFVDYATCNDEAICTNTTYYEINGVSSKKQCAEIDCRTPDHIRYIIRVENLQCSRGTSRNSSTLLNVLAALMALLFYREINRNFANKYYT